jgi:hypothetical protein
MARKLFIVESGNERLYKSLAVALSDEPDVEVFYDRRTSIRSGRRHAEDRRTPSDVEERIQRDGFAVVRIAPRTQSAAIFAGRRSAAAVLDVRSRAAP